MKKYYSVKEIQEIFGCGRSKAYDLLKNGGIPHIRIGRKIYIPISDFEEWQRDRIQK